MPVGSFDYVYIDL